MSHHVRHPPASADQTGPADADSLDELPPPPGGPLAVAAVFQQVLGGLADQGAERTLSIEAPQPPGAPPPIAGYEVLGLLGRGSMGVVYQARQVGLNRLVALKMILAGGHAAPEQRVRFRREAEAVGRLQHPHIVQIYEIGEQGGQPFFSLEYVAGGTLAQHLAGIPQPPGRAAELVATLARAIHYAHQCGVVHRDLKPANVLLSCSRDAESSERSASVAALRSEDSASRLHEYTPKITDFGLATYLGEDSRATETGAILGTPSYMAPEQARGKTRQEPVGPAADVYALGAILYEALTGRPPFLGQTALDTLEQVVSQEPIAPTRLQPRVPRDLETICLKCLQKEPTRRYTSAADLAGDLDRFLASEPIQARPVGLWERGLKWVRRRPMLAALAACCAVLALSLVVGGLVYNAQLRSALVLAREERDRAEDYRQKMLQTVDELLTQVGDQRLADVPEMEEVRRRLLEEALRFYRDLLDSKDHADPAIRREAALAHRRMANILSLLGRLEQAEPHLRQALALHEELAARWPERLDYRHEQAGCFFDLGLLCNRAKRLAEAEVAYRQAITLLRPLRSGQPEYRRTLGVVCHDLAGLLYSQGQLDRAENEFQQGLLIQKTLVDECPDRSLYQIDLADTHMKLGLVYFKTRRWTATATRFRDAETLVKPLADDPAHQRSAGSLLSSLYHNMGRLLGENDRPSGAIEYLEKAIAVRARLARRFPNTPRYRYDLAQSHEGLAGVYIGLHRPDRSVPQLRQALEQWESLARDFPRESLYGLIGVQHYVLLGMQLPAEAEASYRKALTLAERLLHDHPRQVPCQVCLGRACFVLAFHLSRRKPEEALSLCRRAMTALEGVVSQEPQHTDARVLIRAVCELRMAMHEEALWSFAVSTAGLGALPGRIGPLSVATVILVRGREIAGRLNAIRHDLARYRALDPPPAPAKPSGNPGSSSPAGQR